MKKTISTILAITMLTTPLVGTVCFADEPVSNVGAYVQNQERSERFKFDKKTAVKANKIAGYIAAGTTVIVGATAAGLKICEDLLPEQVKEWLPSWFKKGNAQKQESNNFSDNTSINEHTSEDATQYPAADQVDDINLGEKVDSLGKEMHGQSAAPTIEESEPVERNKDTLNYNGSKDETFKKGSKNIPQLMCTEVPRILNTTTAESKSVDNTYDHYLLNEKCWKNEKCYPKDIEDNGRIKYYIALGIAGILALPVLVFTKRRLGPRIVPHIENALSSACSRWPVLSSLTSSLSSSWSQSSVASSDFSSMDSFCSDSPVGPDCCGSYY